MDKSFWRAVVAADYAIPEGHTLDALTEALVGYLGSTDSELRDDIAYGVLVRWMDQGRYSPAALRALLARMLDNLTIGLGENGTDSVFLRSFSVLILAAIVYYDNQRAFLDAGEVHEVLARTLAYFAAEQDVRGYVPGKGWAHSVAHTADLIDELALHRCCGRAEIARLLDALAARLLAPRDTLLLYNEDDRMAYAATSALKRDLLDRAAWRAWLDGMVRPIREVPLVDRLTQPAARARYLDTRHFLQCLNTRLLTAEDLPPAVHERLPDLAAALKALG